MILLAVLAGGIYAVIARRNADNASKPNIRTTTIDRGTLTVTVSATGKVAPQQSISLSFPNPGLVAAIFVAEGQHVAAQQVLIQQDRAAPHLALIQADANFQAAILALQQLMAPPSAADLAVAEANVKAAQTAYNGLLGSVDPNAVAAAQLRLQQAQTAYQDAITHRKDTGGRVPTDSPTYQLALAQEGQASFAVAVAQIQLQIAQRGVDGRLLAAARAKITQAQAQLDQLKAGATPAEVSRAQLAVDQARMARDEAQRQLDATTLGAPFAGVVAAIAARPGALAVGGVPVIVLMDTAQLHVNLSVDEIDIGQVREGQPVQLTLDALPDETLTGNVDRIALVASPSDTTVAYDVSVRLEPVAATVKVGMTATATIIVRELPNVVRVPNSYVRLDRRHNGAYVNLVSSDGSLTEIPVNLGLRTDEYSEILGGLNEGDTVGINLDSTFSLLGN